MNKKTKDKGWLFILLMCVFFLGATAHVEASGGKYSGGIVLDENAEPVRVENGLMPSKGDVDVLVILVEFPDVEHNSVNTIEKVENDFFGDSDELNGAKPASLAKYYEYSSYGQLNISGDVCGWYTAAHERSYYSQTDLELPGNDLLFKEAVTALDEQIDYSKYDSDGDGYIDGIYLMYSGTDEGWGSTFWTYVSTYITEDLVLDGTNLRKFCFLNENYSTNTLCHETGHLLGLMDYYDYELADFSLWASKTFGLEQTMMCGSYGELDALSKILLGWVQPQIITQAGQVSLQPIDGYADAAIVFPFGETNGRTFFLVESYSMQKNNYQLFSEEGLRVYRVNTTLEDGGKGFRYGILQDNDINTIEVALDTGDTLLLNKNMTPYEAPSTYLLEENSQGVAEWKASGISIENMTYNNGEGSFSVKFENIDASRKPSYTINNLFADNKLYIEIDFDVEVQLTDELLEVYAVSDGETIPLELQRNNYSSENQNKFYLYSSGNACKPDTTYTFSIPENSFVSSYGAYTQQISHSVHTANFPQMTEVEANGLGANYSSELVATNDGGVEYISVISNELQKVKISSDGQISYTKIMSIGGQWPNVVRACRLDNGEYIVFVYFTNGDGRLYRIDTTNQGIEIKSGLNVGFASLIAMGNNAVLYACSGSEYYMVEEDNTISSQRGHNGDRYQYIFKLEDDRYLAASAFQGKMYVVDSEMNLIKEVSKPQLNSLSYATSANGCLQIIGMGDGNIGMGSGDPSTIHTVYLHRYDENYNYLGRETLYVKRISDIYDYFGGFAVGMTADRPFLNEEGQGVFYGTISSPVANVSFQDYGFNEQFSLTVDYNNTGAGDDICKVIRLSNGGFAISTSWRIYLVEPYTMPADSVKDFVERMYTVALEREPEVSGLEYWTEILIKRRQDSTQVAYGFIFSEEFKRKNYCNEHYIKQLYIAFMGRESDAEGLNYWLDEMKSGAIREEVFNGFSQSDEFKNICASYGIDAGEPIAVSQYGTVPMGPCSVDGKEDGVTSFVKRLYNICLDREAEEEGLNYWTGQLWSRECSGTTAAHGFIFSSEFTSKNHSDADYVEYLYEAFMGRSSDADGKAYWLEQLGDLGYSRLEVFDGFAYSPEFTEICNSYGIVAY